MMMMATTRVGGTCVEGVDVRPVHRNNALLTKMVHDAQDAGCVQPSSFDYGAIEGGKVGKDVAKHLALFRISYKAKRLFIFLGVSYPAHIPLYPRAVAIELRLEAITYKTSASSRKPLASDTAPNTCSVPHLSRVDKQQESRFMNPARSYYPLALIAHSAPCSASTGSPKGA
jgi:hypothetical protein